MDTNRTIIYTLELNKDQRSAAEKAVHLMIDLKDHKYSVLFPLLAKGTDGDLVEREKAAHPLLKSAFKYIYPSDEVVHDDDYQVFAWFNKELSNTDKATGLTTLVMNPYQAHALNRAVDLLMRLKINQPKELIWHLIDLGDNDFCERRDCAEHYLSGAFKQIYPTWESAAKDKEWHTLYNTHQVLRYAFYKNEHPSSKGVDSYPPTSFSGEPLPVLSYTTA